MKAKNLLILSTVAVCALATACAKSNEPERDETGKVIVTCWINEGNKFEGATKDSILKQIEETCGVNLKISGATHNSDYYTTLNPKVNTGEIPDIIFTVPSGQGNGYNNWINQDLIWNYDELLAEKPGEYKYLEAIFNSNVYKNIQYGENMHTLLPFMSERSGWTIYYRADWLINIGYYTEVDGVKVAKPPVNMDEFQDVMMKFTKNDPDGNGKDDTYALSPGGTPTWFNPLFHAFGVTTDYDLDANNNPVYQYLQPEYKNFLVWANDMYQKGYIDPQFAGNTPNTDDRNKFYTGRSGILITNGLSHVQWVVKGAENVFGKCCVTVGPAPVGTTNIGVPGAHGFSDWGGWWGGFSISKIAKDPHAILKFLNYINGPEGNALFHYGVLGKHYDLGPNGEVIPNIEERDGEPIDTFYSVSDQNGDKNPAGLHQIGDHFQRVLKWNEDETEFISLPDESSIPYEYKDYFRKTIELNSLTTSRLVNVTCWPGAYVTKMKKVEDAAQTYAIKAISGKLNLTSDWDNLMNQVEQKSYEWSKIQQMIKDVARNCGII